MKQTLISILLMLLPIVASADAVEINGIWYNLVPKAKEAEVTSNPNKYSGSIKIPASVSYEGITYRVTSISIGAFSGCSGLASVTIPNSVTSIANSTFYNCTGLTSVTIPNSVTNIGDEAFYGCHDLTSVTIPNSVTSIGVWAFSHCDNLNSVNIYDLEAWCGIKFSNNPFSFSIAHHLYLNGEEIKNLEIPNSVTSINNCDFYNCTGLTSVTIPNSVTSIGSSAFSGCSSLTSVTIGNSVTFIGGSAFQGCNGLTSIAIPNSVTSIGIGAFDGCSGLTSITIPNSVTIIRDYAFQNCPSLTSVTIPNSVTIIRGLAFCDCSSLTDVYCEAEKLRSNENYGEGLYTSPNAFKDSYPQAMTLHVPAASIEAYRSMEPWMNFKSIKTLEGGDIPEIQKCATPVISFVDGQVSITCDTEGAKFVSDVSVSNSTYYDSQFTLPKTYKVSVYATKDGYEASDVATKEITISGESSGQESSVKGDVNGDGEVNVADHVALSDIIMTVTETNIETDKITASFTGGAYIKIDGRIQADSKLNVMFSNKSSKNVTLTKMQLNDAATGIESDNLLDEEVVVAAGQDASYTITVGPLGISKPVISFTYKYNNTTYQAIGEW